jgi:hypothetical protein
MTCVMPLPIWPAPITPTCLMTGTGLTAGLALTATSMVNVLLVPGPPEHILRSLSRHHVGATLRMKIRHTHRFVEENATPKL